MTSPRATTNRSSGGSVGANAPSTPAGAVALTPVGKSHTSAKSAVQSPAAGSSLEPKPKTAGVVQAARGPVQSTASATKPAPAAKQVPAPAPAPAPAAAQHIFLQINHADSSKFRKYKVRMPYAIVLPATMLCPSTGSHCLDDCACVVNNMQHLRLSTGEANDVASEVVQGLCKVSGRGLDGTLTAQSALLALVAGSLPSGLV